MAPSASQGQLSRLLVAEREAAAAVRAAVTSGPRPLAVPLAELRQGLMAAGERWRGHHQSHLRRHLNHDPDVDGGSGDGDGNAILQQDPVLGPMLAAAVAAGVPEYVGLPLTASNLRVLLRQHPCREIRRIVYDRGLLPRLAAALQRLGALAAVRQQLAALQGYTSFSELSYSQTGLAIADAETVLQLLQDLAEGLRPAAEAEVRNSALCWLVVLIVLPHSC